jgi:DNA adenine methylase
MRSFIKWAGGKQKLVKNIIEILPSEFNNYHEPFLGSGAVFLGLKENRKLIDKKVFLSDSLSELITTWKVVKNDTKWLERKIGELTIGFNSEKYYKLREWDRSLDLRQRSDVERAARFIILNHSCFNGLWRVNKYGQNNVPFGHKKKLGLLSHEELANISYMLRNVCITNQKYEKSLEIVEKDDFVYLDPPYLPINDDDGFSNYDGNWDLEDHKKLFLECQKLNDKGVKFILSAHSEPRYKELFSDFNMKTTEVTRSIGASISTRKKVKELLIYNY